MNTRTAFTTRPALPARPAAAPDADPHAGLPTTLLAEDGRPLSASWFEPADGRAHAVALISSAAGVPRGYYRAFAQWLAGRGYAALSYDYRGIGGSRLGRLRDDPATMRDWALLDMSAALAAAQARRACTAAAPLPLLLIGHSFGGNAIAFARGVEQADALLTVGSQLGEPRLFDGRHRLAAEFFFRVLVPALVPLFGHLPAWALGGGAQPLPGGVARQWAQWGLTAGWAYADPAMKAHRQASGLGVPVHLWNLSDDLTFAPPRAVDALAQQFRNAAVQRHTLRPADIGQAQLGHFGVFRRQVGPAAWQRLLAPIEHAVPALRPATPGA
jgi:predicted alpha/beta hydrolase